MNSQFTISGTLDRCLPSDLLYDGPLSLTC